MSNHDWQMNSHDALLAEIERLVEVYANIMTPSIAAAELHRIADEISTMQPGKN